MKTYEQLERGRIIQTKSNGGAMAIVLEHRPERLCRYEIYQMGIGVRIVYPDDIVAIGPMFGEVKLHAAKVLA